MDIIEDIRAAFISNIGSEEWMDDETRETARRKVCEPVLSNILPKNNKFKILGIMQLRYRSFAIHLKTRAVQEHVF